MGKIAIIMIFMVLIIIGSVMMILHQKQYSAVETLSELTFNKQVRHLANMYANSTLNELKELVVANNGLTNISSVLETFNNKPPIENTEFPDATIQTHISQENYQGVNLEDGQFVVIATATITGDEGKTYKTETHIVFKFGESNPTPNPPTSSEDGAPTSRLNFLLKTDSIFIGFANANNDNGNMFQGGNQEQNKWDVIEYNRLKEAGYSYVLLPNEPNPGGIALKVANNHSSVNNPDIPNYPLNIYMPARTSNSTVKTVRIDSSLFAKEKKRENLNLYIDGNVEWGPDGNGITTTTKQIYANIYHTGTIFASISGATKVSYHGGFLFTSSNKEIYTSQVTKAELEEMWEHRNDGSDSDPSTWAPIINSWVETPIEINP